jgi:hypothetical protein
MREYECGKCGQSVGAVSVTDYSRPSREGYELMRHGNLDSGECPNRDRVRVACKCGQLEYADADLVAASVSAGGSPWGFCGSCRERVRF